MKINKEQLEQDLMDTAELLERLADYVKGEPDLRDLAKLGAEKMSEYAMAIGNELYS
jgi:hypothetical protein